MTLADYLNLERFQGVKAVICDIWGVVHNGRTPYPHAVRALQALQSQGLPVLLMTNSPRRAEGVEEQLRDIGVPACYDDLLTSGDMVFTWLKTHTSERIYWLGPQRDAGVFDGISVHFTDADSATAVFCTGLMDDDVETPEMYRSLLQGFARRGLPFICANPDKVAHRGDKLIYCAGALAELYETLGGKTIAFGKPYAPIYEEAERRLGLMGKNILAIGDNLETDIEGALARGYHTLFISQGIHRGQAFPDLAARGVHILKMLA